MAGRSWSFDHHGTVLDRECVLQIIKKPLGDAINVQAGQLGFEIRKMLDAPYRLLLCMGNDNLGCIWPQPQGNGSLVGTIIQDQIDQLMFDMGRGPVLEPNASA